MDERDKAYLARRMGASRWRSLVPITGRVNWGDMSSELPVIFHQAELDFIDKSVRLTTSLLSFNDVRQLFYAMVAGEEVVL